MNKIYTFLLAASTVFCVGAKDMRKFDSQTLLNLSQYQSELTEAAVQASRGASATVEVPSVSAFVRLEKGSDASFLSRYGAEVLGFQSNIAMINIPVDRIEELSDDKRVSYIESSRKRESLMDKAVPDSHVDVLHLGTGLEQSYKGDGVILGIVDTGIDPGHINFRYSDDLENTRVKRVFHFSGSNGLYKEYDEMFLWYGNFTTDNYEESHGTHVLGIMAGSYPGNLDEIAVLNSENKTEVKTNVENPYIGVAPNAELAVACMKSLDDSNIVNGVEAIIKYAESVGKPCAINLSLGSIVGAHDESDLVNQYMAALGQRAIICLAAGNDGDKKPSADKRFTENDTELATLVKINNKSTTVADILSDDDTPFKLRISSLNGSTQEFVYDIPMELGTISIGNSSLGAAYIKDPNFDAVFNNGSYVTVTTSMTSTGRYMIEVRGKLTYIYSNTRLGLEITGQPGQHVCVWANNELTNNRLEHWQDGDNNNSISSFACSKNVVTVGSYNTNNRVAYLDGQVSDFGSAYAAGLISPFSSYGTLYNGETRPHVTAPGSILISSYNSYCTDDAKSASAKTYDDFLETDHYWGMNMGTSMACPMVTGIMGLWLEANPDLTVDNVLEVLKKTSTIDSRFRRSGPAEKLGWGKINALEGLKMVLTTDFTGISDIFSPENGTILISAVSHNVYEVFAPEATSLSYEIYTLGGQKVVSEKVVSDSATVDCTSLQPGIYIVKASAANATKSQKIVVK